MKQSFFSSRGRLFPPPLWGPNAAGLCTHLSSNCFSAELPTPQKGYPKIEYPPGFVQQSAEISTPFEPPKQTEHEQIKGTFFRAANVT